MFAAGVRKLLEIQLHPVAVGMSQVGAHAVDVVKNNLVISLALVTQQLDYRRPDPENYCFDGSFSAS